MRPKTAILGALAVLAFGVAASAQTANKRKEEKPNGRGPVVANPILFLLRDAVVQADLQMRDDQKKAVRILLDEIDGPLWLLRDTTPEEGYERVTALITKAKSGLNGMLNPTQLKRLDQIVLQAQGTEALYLPGVAQKLGLSNDQRKQIRETIEARRQEGQELLKLVREGKEKEPDAKAAKIRSAEHEQLLIILSEDQKKQWAALLGKAIDLSKVEITRIKAPELVVADEWINSEPLTLAKLKGRVVALHFWTFG